jgi:hypothetical protein
VNMKQAHAYCNSIITKCSNVCNIFSKILHVKPITFVKPSGALSSKSCRARSGHGTADECRTFLRNSSTRRITDTNAALSWDRTWVTVVRNQRLREYFFLYSRIMTASVF